MSERPNTVHGLIAKRADIAGKIEHLQDELRTLVIDLDNLDHTIHLFDPTIELAEISKRPVPHRHQAFKGEVTRIVLTTLRNAKKPLTTHDVAQRVMSERGLDTANEKLLKLMVKRAGACMRHWEQKGVLKKEQGPNQFKLWSVADRHHRPSPS